MGVAPVVVERGPRDVDRTRLRPDRAATALVGCVVLGLGLRWWDLGGHLYGFDEAYTAMVARRSPGALWGFVRSEDVHPPLDYLLRMPWVGDGYDLFALRFVSAVCSSAALVAFAWWMRSRGWFGVLATGLMAGAGFAVFFGREARMYAVLQLVGVLIALVLDGWFRAPKRWHAVAVGGLVAAAALTHVSMLPFAVGLLAAPLARTDRAAWRWRAGVLGGLAVWAVVWGPSFLAQRAGSGGSWAPRTSWESVRAALGRLVVFTSGSELLGVVALVVGLVCLARLDPALARVATFGFVVPAVVLLVVGLVEPMMIERMFTLGSWAVFPALAAIPAALAARGRRFGVLGALLVVLLVAPGGVGVLRTQWEADALVRRLRAASAPGDVVAVVPGWWGPLVEYGVGVAAGGGTPVRVAGVDDTTALRLGGAPATGRVWLVVRSTRTLPLAGYDRCSRETDDGVFRVVCVVAGDAVRARG